MRSRNVIVYLAGAICVFVLGVMYFLLGDAGYRFIEPFLK